MIWGFLPKSELLLASLGAFLNVLDARVDGLYVRLSAVSGAPQKSVAAARLPDGGVGRQFKL